MTIVKQNKENNPVASQDESVDESVEESKKYAGTFESVEELEKAYNESRKYINGKNSIQNELEKIKAETQVPDSYEISVPSEDYKEMALGLQDSAKKLGLTQSQFNSFVNETISKVESQKEESQKRLDSLNSKYGENGLKQLKQYIKNEHHLSEDAISKLSEQDLETLNAKRQEYMESPMSSGSYANFGVTRDDVSALYNKFMQSPPGEQKDRAYEAWCNASKSIKG